MPLSTSLIAASRVRESASVSGLSSADDMTADDIAESSIMVRRRIIAMLYNAFVILIIFCRWSVGVRPAGAMRPED